MPSQNTGVVEEAKEYKFIKVDIPLLVLVKRDVSDEDLTLAVYAELTKLIAYKGLSGVYMDDE